MTDRLRGSEEIEILDTADQDDLILEEEQQRGSVGRWVALAVGIGLLVVVAGIVVLGDSESGVDGRLVGSDAPAVEGTTIDGESFALADQQGQWVVVNFFASWCTPCRVEHPELVAFSERHQETGDATVVGVAFDDAPDDATAFFEELGGDWPAIAENTGGIAVDYGVIAAPETYLVDPDGVVAAKWTGPVTASSLESAMRAAGQES